MIVEGSGVSRLQYTDAWRSSEIKGSPHGVVVRGKGYVWKMSGTKEPTGSLGARNGHREIGLCLKRNEAANVDT